MIRVIQRRLIIPRGDTGTFTVPALSPGQSGSVGVFTIFDPITKTRIFQKQVELQGNVFNIEFGHGDTVNLQAGDYLWDIKFYKNPIFADNKVIDGEEIDSYYAAFQTPKCEIRETGDAFMNIDGAHAAPEDLNIILAATQSANESKEAAADSATSASESAASAADSATAAAASAQAALDSQNAALASQQAAQASANNAADSESAASASASAASASAARADASAINAAQSADDAAASAQAAQQAQSAAESARSGATTQASNASASASAAADSASAALVSQQAAAASASAALTSEQNAAASETNAANSATAAAASAILAQQTAQAIHEEIPTQVSQLENDAGYLTEHQDISMKANSADLATVATSGEYSDLLHTPTNVSVFTNDAGYLTEHQDISGKANSADLAAVATSGSYNDLSNKPTIPEVPVQDVQVNGVGVVVNKIAKIQMLFTSVNSSYGIASVSGQARILPAIPSLIKQNYETATDSQKTNMSYRPIVPSVQHISTFYGLAKAAGDATQSESDNAVGTYTDSAKTAIQQMLGVPSTTAIPTLVSQLTNDSGYLTSFTETDPTVPSWAKAAQKPTYTAAEVGAPTVQEMNSAISTAIGNINSFDMAVVQELPIQDISTHTIYLVPKTGDTNDVYDEYVYINGNWEMVGNTQVDLSNYVQKTDYATANKAGVVKIHPDLGVQKGNGGLIYVNAAVEEDIKLGADSNYIRKSYKPIVPNTQHYATFYGLAKAAGDTTQSQSDNAVGNYTTEAKAAIRSMIGAAASADVTVQDVQINGTSIVENGIAAIPKANASTYGVIKTDSTYGIGKTSSGSLTIINASQAEIKAGTSMYKVLVPIGQHESVFYGLAKAAGDTTQSQSDNAVGTYTAEAKAAILNMLGAAASSDIPEVPVQDVQIDNNSIIENGIADIPIATNNSNLGLVKINPNYGIAIGNASTGRVLLMNQANVSEIKSGAGSFKTITPTSQHHAVFYGLAKIAGADEKDSTLAVGTYTSAAKTAIQNMLGITDALAAKLDATEAGIKVVRLI